jgi:polysaccharide biosynthesis protein PslH
VKVMHILSYVPIPLNSGGKLRVYYVMKALTKHHDVTVVSYGTPAERDLLHAHFGIPLENIHIIPSHFARRHRRLMQVLALGTRHSFYHYDLNSPQMEATVASVLASESFDVIQTEFPLIGASRCETDAVKILDAHNVEYEIFKRISETDRSALRGWYNQREYHKVRREELAILGRQDALFVTSERDGDLIAEDLPHIPKHVIPNGVDVGYFKASQVTPEPHTLVFTGTMAYQPNSTGMLFFLDEVFPSILREIPDAKIYIVGNKPPPELANRASDHVIVTGLVDDVRPFMDRASAVVVPLLAGSGTRLKILEALSMKKPVVTTTIGGEGIDLVHGESAMIADDPEDFAQNVVQLLRNPELQTKLRDVGYRLVSDRYDWSIIGEQIQGVYEDLVPLARESEKLAG